MMKKFLETRRALRRKINSNDKIDAFLHFFIIVVLAMNSILILYSILELLVRMTLSGIGLVDSIPIALYVLPLLVFLPMMIISYRRDRAALWNFILLLISSSIFGMIAILIRGFIIVLALNIIGLISIFILGRFRPKGGLKNVGKKGLAYFVLLNVLGLTFPVSVIVMGQNPVAVVEATNTAQITLDVPLDSFDFPYQEVSITPALLSNLTHYSLSLDLRVLEGSVQSWLRLRNWLITLNTTDVSYYITLSANRTAMIDDNLGTLGTTGLIEEIYLGHKTAFRYLLNTSLLGIVNRPLAILFDMTLSHAEWQVLMAETRSIDLIGFSALVRNTIDSINRTRLDYEAESLYNEVALEGMNAGVLVESFVVDDIQDNDTTFMQFCGLSTQTIQLWDIVSVLTSRSRFSFEMNGDVGEYLAYSYSASIAKLGEKWSMRIGHFGNQSDISDRVEDVYPSVDSLANDVVISAGNGVGMIALESLPALVHLIGENSISQFMEAILSLTYGVATYTFRIYAFRAVPMTIDSFDNFMF